MPGSLNPKDNSHTSTTRPPFVPSGAGARRWFSTGLSTRVADQDLNNILAQIRTACDFYGIADVEGDDTMLQKALTAATGSVTGNLALFQALRPLTGDLVPYFSGASAMNMFTATSFSRGLMAQTSAAQWRDALGMSAAVSDNVVAFGALPSATDQLPYFTGAATMDQTPFKAFGRSLVGAQDAAAGRTVLGLGTMATAVATDYVPKAGGAYTGLISLSANPTAALHATPKQYVDAADALLMPKAGGTFTGPVFVPAPTADLHAASKLYVDGFVSKAGSVMTGLLTLSGPPTAGGHATTKTYVDAADAATLPKAGGTMTGAITLHADPAAPLHAATKQYVDLHMPKAGGVFTGPVTLSGDPTLALHPASKQYVDSASNIGMPKSGGTFTGPITLSGPPTQDLHATTRAYVDTHMPKAGGVFTGLVTLSANPAAALDAAPKQYVDGVGALMMPKAGGTFTGAVFLFGAPTNPTHAATKAYVDTFMPKAGGAFTGLVTLSADPTLALHAATMQYVDAKDTLGMPKTGGLFTGRVSFIDANFYAELMSGNPNLYFDVGDTIRYVRATDVFQFWAGNTLALTVYATGVDAKVPLNVIAPTAAFHATNKSYVDTAVALAMPKSGGTFTGPISLAGAPTDPLHAVNKGYVDAAENIGMPKSGGMFTGDVSFYDSPFYITSVGGNPHIYFDVEDYFRFTRTADQLTLYLAGVNTFNISPTLAVFNLPVKVAEPTAITHATTKKYVDDAITAASAADNLLAMPKTGGLFSGQVDFGDGAFSIFKTGAGNPQIGLDAGDYLVFNRSSDTLSLVLGAVATLTMTPAQAIFSTVLRAAEPTQPTHLTTRKYVDDNLALAKTASDAADLLLMPKAGGTFTGLVTLSGAPTSNLHASTKKYVDDGLAAALTASDAADALLMPKTGGTFTGNVNFTDAKYTLNVSNDNPQIVFDATDYFRFIRASDQLNLIIGAVNLFNITPALAVFNVPVKIGEPTAATHATTRTYVDAALAAAKTASDAADLLAMPKAGGAFTGLVSLSAAPTVDLHAATKKYVDDGLAAALAASDVADAKLMPKTGGDFTNFVKVHADPTLNLHVAPKQYVDAMGAAQVSKTGGTMTGFLVLSADPTNPMHASTRKYVDDGLAAARTASDAADALAMPKTGGTFTGIVNVQAPTTTSNATTKKYVDDGNLLLMPKTGGLFSGQVQVVDTNFNLALVTNPVINFDVGDSFRFTRGTDTFQFFVASTAVFNLSSTEANFTVPVKVPVTPTVTVHAASKKYVDDSIAAAIATAMLLPASPAPEQLPAH